MKLFEAVKTIRDYCSNTMCGDCPFAVLYKIDRYNGKIWRCELAGTPYEWEVPETTIEKDRDYTKVERCADCKYYTPISWGEGVCYFHSDYDGNFRVEGLNDFCSRGVKKE